MNTPPAAPPAGASACDVRVIGGAPADSTTAALLAGDVHGKSPTRGPLLLFKGLYYATSRLNFKRTLKASRVRQRNMRAVDEIGAATN